MKDDTDATEGALREGSIQETREPNHLKDSPSHDEVYREGTIQDWRSVESKEANKKADDRVRDE